MRNLKNLVALIMVFAIAITAWGITPFAVGIENELLQGTIYNSYEEIASTTSIISGVTVEKSLFYRIGSNYVYHQGRLRLGEQMRAEAFIINRTTGAINPMLVVTASYAGRMVDVRVSSNLDSIPINGFGLFSVNYNIPPDGVDEVRVFIFDRITMRSYTNAAILTTYLSLDVREGDYVSIPVSAHNVSSAIEYSVVYDSADFELINAREQSLTPIMNAPVTVSGVTFTNITNGEVSFRRVINAPAGVINTVRLRARRTGEFRVDILENAATPLSGDIIIPTIYEINELDFDDTHMHEDCIDCVDSEYQPRGYSNDDIQRILNNGGRIYRNLRVHCDTFGTTTYNVPVSQSEIERVLNIQNGINFATYNPFPVTRIRYSGRPHEDSIVVILLSDGFTAAQHNVVLNHANNAMDSMLAIHPFGLFEDLFTVYVIHTHGNHPVTGIGYLGTITTSPGTGTVLASPTFTRTVRIYELANTVVAPEHQTMIQVISNAGDVAGWAQLAWHYRLGVTISVTSIVHAATPPGGSSTAWPNGTMWHGIFVHELGHSFGGLVDEHATGGGSTFMANSTPATIADEDVKWRHWFGHRNVAMTPRRFPNGWAVPTASGSDCHMGLWSVIRDFCGVCTAELVRRMALASGEVFHSRKPGTNDPLPNTPTVTMPQGATRILDSAFHGNTSLQTIHIPESVATIGDFAFIGATGLRTIVNNRAVPQQINATTFAGVNRANVDVLIPVGTTQAFRNAGWAEFNLIEIEIDAISRVPNVAFNGTTFTLNTIEVVERSAFEGTELFVEIRKRSGSTITTTPRMAVVTGQSGIGRITDIPTSVNSFAIGEYIEILIFSDNAEQAPIARHLVNPVTF